MPSNLTLPIPWSLNKHDPALKESRRKGLDAYLQVLLTDEKLIKNPQSFEMIVMFLSESYVRENQYINRKVLFKHVVAAGNVYVYITSIQY